MLSRRKKKWMSGRSFTHLYKEFGLVEHKILLRPKLNNFCLYWYIRALCWSFLTSISITHFCRFPTFPNWQRLWLHQIMSSFHLSDSLLQIICPCDWHLPKKMLGKGLYYFQVWPLRHPEEPNGSFWLPSHPEAGNHWALGNNGATKWKTFSIGSHCYIKVTQKSHMACVRLCKQKLRLSYVSQENFFLLFMEGRINYSNSKTNQYLQLPD